MSQVHFLHDEQSAFFSMIFQIFVLFAVPVISITGFGHTVIHFELTTYMFDSGVLYWTICLGVILGVLSGATNYQGEFTIAIILMMMSVCFGSTYALIYQGYAISIF